MSNHNLIATLLSAANAGSASPDLLREAAAALSAREAAPAALSDIEQYRQQMAGISTAALGYWKEGDRIHPDYDTPALRDVAKLYAKYALLAQRAAPADTETALAHVKQQAAIWKMEARTMKRIVDGVCEVIGVPSYGPVVQTVRELKEKAAAPAVPTDVERDAARYRWLRRWKGQEHEPLFTVQHEIDGTLWSLDLDRAIDAAMLAAAPEAKP